jgi:hypothetical protein
MKRTLAMFVLITAQSCYVAKPLEREVHVSVNKDFPVVIRNEGNSNFSSRHSEEEYRQAYIKDMTTEFGADHVIVDDAHPEFIVNIALLEITESTKMDTVKDAKSKDNGMVREITLGGLKTHGTVMKPGGTEIKWDAERDKNEELTSNRSLGQIIEGENKEGTEYRLKSFDDNEFVVQAGHCGRRAAVRVVQQIKKQLGQ